MELASLFDDVSANTVATFVVLVGSIGINGMARHVTHNKTRLILASIADLLGQTNVCPKCGQDKPECPCQAGTGG